MRRRKFKPMGASGGSGIGGGGGGGGLKSRKFKKIKAVVPKKMDKKQLKKELEEALNKDAKYWICQYTKDLRKKHKD